MYGEIRSLGANLVAISPQLPRYSKQVVKKNGLEFPVLADIGNTVATTLGLTFALPEAIKTIYSSFGIDLSRYNGSDSWELPLSGRFIVDAQGIIKDVEVHPDYTVRPDPSEIVVMLKGL